MQRKHLATAAAAFLGLIALGLAAVGGLLLESALGAAPPPPPPIINTIIPAIQTDRSINYNYDIVATRAPRNTLKDALWPDIHNPLQMDVGQDLVLIHPNGTEETLVAGGTGSCADPAMSFDGTTVYYSYYPIQAGKPTVVSKRGCDIYKMVLATRQITQLTSQTWETTALASGPKLYGVFNAQPCPLPDGRIAFVSNRQGRVSLKRNQPTTQLYVMDADGSNVECIGSLNVGGALHPTMLQDGRLIFSSEESQGLRGNLQWSLWSIWPDGSVWEPIVSHFWNSPAAVDSWHFQAQLSDGNLIALFYYNEGFGQLFKLPVNSQAFGSAHSVASILSPVDPRNPLLAARPNGPGFFNWPFMPYNIQSITPWTTSDDRFAPLSNLIDPLSTRVGKFTHPSAAPDNHLLVCYSPEAAHDGGNPRSQGTICLLKSGESTSGPNDLRMIKSDPDFNYRQPVAVVSYLRISGYLTPKVLPTIANDGSLHPALPAGSPYGLIGVSSLYKRESYPNGVVVGITGSEPDPIVPTPKNPGRLGAYNSLGTFYGSTRNYNKQGGDDGLYTNDDIHAIRILILEPTSDGLQYANKTVPSFFNHCTEKIRIAGEFPVRKFTHGVQPVDPDGSPDTSFLAKIPADTPFTFQTLDKDGLQLNHASTWHQLRPGEVRNNCGGCHSHSQTPTEFTKTAAALKSYEVWDLTQEAPFLTLKNRGQTHQQWDAADSTGVIFGTGPLTVEWNRDVKPILTSKCIKCHTQAAANPPGHLVLDDDTPYRDPFFHTILPGSYARLATDTRGTFSYPSDLAGGYGAQNASRYIKPLQSRRSLLLWKIYGRRLDGMTNDTAPSTLAPGDLTTAQWQGVPYKGNAGILDLDYNGRQCPPSGSPQLTDEDKRTIARWVDTGCGIDLNAGQGYLNDDYRPTLTVQSPARGANAPLSVICIGAADYGSGLDPTTLSVVADFTIDAQTPGMDLASRFKTSAPGVWQYKLKVPIKKLAAGNLTVSVKDRAGNMSRVIRTIRIGQ